MPVLMKLRLFRVGKQLTIEQFAEKLGYGRRHYSDIEKGKIKPTLRLCESLQTAFGMTLDEAKELTKN